MTKVRTKSKMFPQEFWQEFAEVRSSYGETEYDRDDLRVEVEKLIIKYHGDALARRRFADALMNDVEQKEDKEFQPGLFPYDAHVALGEKRRVKRAVMTVDQHERFKRIIDKNMDNQHRAWASNNGWIIRGVDALRGHPEGTRRCDILNEDGTSAKKHK